ncbi:MAG TPA: bifunctional DNA-formamidopyrimidine glycosylase/DNA-(apurinic or apyrimidinic site) lyase [Bryobacterales bacterium]|jgi:formamidopyrimidine-DNA glycosylase|nr:bifunctional DNA-formamidopyrimidine glycosylase/DNA-(apurinic or apyrimidinic site) lyase [Bryobacterales bacterium]
MPELPEVETIVRGLASRLPNRRIERIEVFQPRVIIGDIQRAEGFTIAQVRRRGKFVLLDLERGGRRGHLLAHLGMTGQLRLAAEPGPYTRVLFQLDKGALLYNDVRQFGRLEFAERLPARFKRLGSEPLEIGEEEFVRRFRARRAMVKPLLLNQAFLSGLGNIYVDEALFRARIHPRALANRIRPGRAAKLYRAIVRVLREAIAHRGSSISNYVGSDGRRGAFQHLHKVYRRTGLPCPVCGAAIRRILVSQRGTHFCPRCQKIRSGAGRAPEPIGGTLGSARRGAR